MKKKNMQSNEIISCLTTEEKDIITRTRDDIDSVSFRDFVSAISKMDKEKLWACISFLKTDKD